jgi:hypothetical protein
MHRLYQTKKTIDQYLYSAPPKTKGKKKDTNHTPKSGGAPPFTHPRLHIIPSVDPVIKYWVARGKGLQIVCLISVMLVPNDSNVIVKLAFMRHTITEGKTRFSGRPHLSEFVVVDITGLHCETQGHSRRNRGQLIGVCRIRHRADGALALVVAGLEGDDLALLAAALGFVVINLILLLLVVIGDLCATDRNTLPPDFLVGKTESLQLLAVPLLLGIVDLIIDKSLNNVSRIQTRIGLREYLLVASF